MSRDYWRYLLWALVLAIATANVGLLLRNPLNNDVSWYLYVGQELLAGKHLYVDIIETNPPLICFLSAAAVWIAGVVGAPPKTIWIVLVTCLITALSVVSATYWSHARNARADETRLTIVYLLVSSLAFFFAFDFGQRDHLAFVASLAVAALMAARVAPVPVNRATAVLVSVTAGLLLALKPFFLIPWFLCLLFAAGNRGWRTLARCPEIYIVPGMSLVQPALVLFVTPSYIQVARLVTELYSAYNSAGWVSLLTDRFMVIAIVGTAATFLYRPAPGAKEPIRLAGLTGIGWILSGLLQRKGWHYHNLPAVAAFGFTAWLILLDLATKRAEARASGARLPRVMQAAALALIAFAGVRTLRLHWDYAPGTRPLIPIIDREARGGNVVGLSTGMFLFPVVNETGVRFGAHYNSLWPLPGLYAEQIKAGTRLWRYRKPQQMPPAEKEMLDRIYSDLAAEPQLIIFARDNQGMGSLSVDLPEYLRQDARIREVLNHYETIGPDTDFQVYRLQRSGGVR